MTHLGKLAVFAALFLSGVSVSAESPDASNALQRVIAQLMERKSQNSQFRGADTSSPAAQVANRPDVPTGTRISLFANYLEEACGTVLLDINGATQSCEVVEWRPESVTLQLPVVGLARPAQARIRIVKPNGRVAKLFPIRLVPQPQIVIHGETAAQPMPSAAPEFSDGAGELDLDTDGSGTEAIEDLLMAALLEISSEQAATQAAAEKLAAQEAASRRELERRLDEITAARHADTQSAATQDSGNPRLERASRGLDIASSHVNPSAASKRSLVSTSNARPQPSSASTTKGVAVRRGAMMLFGSLD